MCLRLGAATRGACLYLASGELLPLSRSGRHLVAGDESAAVAGDPQVRRAVASMIAGFCVPTNAGIVINRGEDVYAERVEDAP